MTGSTGGLLVRRSHGLLILIFIVLGAPFVLRYRSEGAAIGPYSTRYFIGVLLPFVAVSALALVLCLGRRDAEAWLAPMFRWIPRPLAVIAGLAAWAAGMVWALRISDEYVSVLMLFLVPCSVLLVWSRSGGAVEPLIPSAILLAAGITLFGMELPDLLRGPAPVVWGDDSTFATLFPRQTPFIGEGGRLRPRLDARMRAPEYRPGARLVTNAAGFRNEEEFSRQPAAGELRILSLGDSFSTGFGADQDAFFGAVLERGLRADAPGAGARVMNAEVSDPAYGLHYLQRHGISWRPHLVIYGLSGNDAMQAEQFYGADRLFRLDGSGSLQPNPAFDPAVRSAWDRFNDFAYPAIGEPGLEGPAIPALFLRRLVRFRAFGALVEEAARAGGRPADMPGYADAYERDDGRKRLVDGSSNLGLYYAGGGEPVERMYAALFDLLAAMGRTAHAGGAGFALVIHPQRYQAQPPDWEFLMRRWRLDERDFDLKLANRRIAAFCRERRILCCDLLDAFTAAARRRSLYLPGGDTHYNRHGHQVAGEAAARCLAESGILQGRS